MAVPFLLPCLAVVSFPPLLASSSRSSPSSKQQQRLGHSTFLFPLACKVHQDPQLNKHILFLQQYLASRPKAIGFFILFEGSPRGPQEASRSPPRRLQLPLPQDAPQEAPTGPSRGPEERLFSVGKTFFRRRTFFECPKEVPRGLHEAPQEASTGPQTGPRNKQSNNSQTSDANFRTRLVSPQHS